MTGSSRRDLVDRLRYTFITTDYAEIDILIAGLRRKGNFEYLCDEFFYSCHIDSRGYLVPSGFFHDDSGSASLLYAMYELLGSAPDTFLLKHRVTRAKFVRKNLSGTFRLPGGLFRLPRLEALYVRGIGISRLPEDAASAPMLKILDLTGNRFSVFPGPVLKMTRLSALNLSYNTLDSLPDGMGRLKKLKILNLRGNRIEKLPDHWHRLQSLHTVDLSMNRISRVPDTLRNPVSLSRLNLAYNNLTASEEAFWQKRAAEQASSGQGSLGIGG